MKKQWITAGIALALGLVWTAGPALAQQTTGEKIKDKAHDAKEAVKDKAEDIKDKAVETKDKIKDKVRRDDKADKVADKADRTADKAESKMDKAKDKAHDAKEKVKAKAHRAADKMEAKAEKADVKATQQALKDKGFNPGPIDGRMGPRTKTALLDFQRKEGLKITGRMDDETMAKLGVRTAAAKTDTLTPAASPTTAPASQPPAATPEDKTTPPGAKQNP